METTTANNNSHTVAPSHSPLAAHSPKGAGATTSAFCFDVDSKRWIRYNSGDSFSLKGQGRLRLVTWKLWYDHYYLEERLVEMVRALEEADADVVALQQVTRGILGVLVRSPFVRNNYYLSDVDGSTLNPTGVLILAKFPLSHFTFHTLESKTSRRMLLGKFKVNKSFVTIATACLEPQKLSSDPRIKQATSIQSTLSDISNCFLLLSANHWGYAEQENILNCFSQMSDSWVQLYSNEQGLTVDTLTNGMIKKKDGEERRDRADFILQKTSNWKPVEAKILGNTPVNVEKKKNTEGTVEGVVGTVEDQLASLQVAPQTEMKEKDKEKKKPTQKEVVFPCNHFGLLVTFEYVN